MLMQISICLYVLSEPRTFLIQIGSIEISQVHESLEIVKCDLATAEGQKFLFAQLPQDAVDMYRTQAQRVRQHD